MKSKYGFKKPPYREYAPTRAGLIALDHLSRQDGMSSSEIGLDLRSLTALEKVGLVTSENGEDAFAFPARGIKWTITELGRATLSKIQSGEMAVKRSRA